jgi:integrase
MTEVEIKFIKAYSDRHGKMRYYFRRKGYPGDGVALPTPGSAGFLAAYEAARGMPPCGSMPEARIGFLPGTLGNVIERFLGSEQFRDRAENTKRQDRRILDELRRGYGAGMLHHLRADHVKQIRNDFSDRFTKSIADAAIAKLSVLWVFADEVLNIKQLGANPTVGIGRLHKTRKKHEPWPADVIAAFCKAASAALKLAVVLLLYTGQRRSDVVKMRWSQFDGEMIEVVQQKTGEFVAIPCHQRLKEILVALPRKSDFILAGERTLQYKPDSLTRLVAEQLHDLGIHGYSVHGLRSNAAQALAEVGCSVSEIMAITGHTSSAMALHYARRAERKKLARNAIDRWEAADQVSNLRTKAV